MSAKENQNKDYVNDEVTVVGTECEYVYEEGSIDDSTYVYEEESKKRCTYNDLEISVHTYEKTYVEHDNNGYFEDNDAEYVLDVLQKTTKKKQLSSESDKPKHKKSDAGIYDELDYTLSPRNELARTDDIVVKDIGTKDSWFDQQKIVIITVIVIFLLAAVVAGTVFATEGKF